MKGKNFRILIIGKWEQTQCINAIAQVMAHFGGVVYDGHLSGDDMPPLHLGVLPDAAVNGIVKWFEETYYRK